MINKKDLELKLLLRESHIQQLNLRVDNLSNTIDKLLQRNDDLKERINKAINYLQNTYYWNLDNEELLNILKGVDKE